MELSPIFGEYTGPVDGWRAAASALSNVRLPVSFRMPLSRLVSITVLTMLPLASAAIAQTAAPTKPAVELRAPADATVLETELRLPSDPETPPVLDWGIVPPDTMLYARIRLVNDTDESVKLMRMAASCQCTTLADLSGSVIEPGESLSFDARVDSKPNLGKSTSEIRFVFEGYPTMMKVILQSSVSRTVQADPPYMLAHENQFGGVVIRSVDEKPFRILSAGGENPVYADGFRPGSAPRNSYTIYWNMSAYDVSSCKDADGNTMPWYWIVETDHPDTPLVPVQVRHQPCTVRELPRRGDREWFLSRVMHFAGPIGEATTFDYQVRFQWLPKSVVSDRPSRVTSDSPELFDAELVSSKRIEGDDEEIEMTIRITMKPGTRGIFQGFARVHGERPGHSEKMVVIGRVGSPEVSKADAGS